MVRFPDLAVEVSLGMILNTSLILVDDLCYQALLVVTKTREVLCKYSLFTILKKIDLPKNSKCLQAR